jgi:hypothetical protein
LQYEDLDSYQLGSALGLFVACTHLRFFHRGDRWQDEFCSRSAIFSTLEQPRYRPALGTVKANFSKADKRAIPSRGMSGNAHCRLAARARASALKRSANSGLIYLLPKAIHPSSRVAKCETAGDLIRFVPVGAH